MLGKRRGAEKANIYIYISVGEKRNVMCVREMAQFKVPVSTVPTIRCSAKAKYCTGERWVRENQCVQRGHQEGHARSVSQKVGA